MDKTRIVRLARKIAKAVDEEIGQLRPLDHMLDVVAHSLPGALAQRGLVATVRARGIEVGAGTVFEGPPELGGGEHRRLFQMSIGKDCVIGRGCSFELGEWVRIGNRVTLGDEVMIITTTHELGPRDHRAGPLVRTSVTVEDGAWIGPRCVILPGVTVGSGAIVEAGSVVNKNVPANARVRGTPARVVEQLA